MTESWQLQRSNHAPLGQVLTCTCLTVPTLTSIVEPAWQRTHLRVPREDGALLARPALSEVIDLARSNAELLAASDATVLDQPLSEFRQQARTELLALAQQETSSLLAATGWHTQSAAMGVVSDSTSTPAANHALPVGEGVPPTSPLVGSNSLLIATGHQPEMFHPGVWIKHLAVGAIAKQHGAIGLNLVVDNDTLNGTALRVPVGSRESLSVDSIAFDVSRPAQPWEEACILDRTLFESFADRVAESLAPWGLKPLLRDVWPHVVSCSRSDSNLAACLTATRARVERDWGIGNLELRMSRLCESTGFRRFALHLIRNAERLRLTYNETVAEYRRINHIRNTSHPMPDLQCVADWIEVPLWIWKAGSTSRGRVFVCERAGKLLLADAPDSERVVMELDASSIEASLAQLSRLSEQGWRLRSRALTTTCFARLCLCDVFVHGIGGAKYDEITDRLMTRFFHVTAPAFLTLSATALLPFTPAFESTVADVRRLKHELRDAQQNAQRHLDASVSGSLAALLTERESLVSDQAASDARRLAAVPPQPNDESGYHRYRRLRELTRELATSTLEKQSQLQKEISRLEHEVAANKIILSREFASWLYPADRLRNLLSKATGTSEE